MDDQTLSNLGIHLPSNEECEAFSALDQICSLFEQDWELTTSPKKMLLMAENAPETHRHRLLLELALCDMELRWREWAKAEKKRFFENAPATFPGSLVFDAEDYVEELELDDHLDRLKKQEFQFRTYYGDFPKRKNIEAFNDVAEIKVWLKDNLAFSGQYTGALVVGRRTGTEPKPIALQVRPNGQKLILAGKSDQFVSREQLSIRFHTNQLVWLENLSQTVDVDVTAMKSRKVEFKVNSGSKSLVCTPISIHIDSFKIEIHRNS